jgi:hypothetical protein
VNSIVRFVRRQANEAAYSLAREADLKLVSIFSVAIYHDPFYPESFPTIIPANEIRFYMENKE